MFAKIKKIFKSIGKCCRPNCENPAAVFGVCEECIHEEWTQVDDRIENEEHQKLVKAFKQAIREVEEERKRPNIFSAHLKNLQYLNLPSVNILLTPNTHMNTETQIRNTKGRFFGVTLKNGETFNAQLRGETAKSFQLYDRNDSRQRRVLKRLIVGVNCR